MQKDILFYSNFCEFSKEVLGLITKNNLKDRFMLVCVDNKNLTLPPFVDRVPLIYNTARKLFADENLVNFIQGKVVSSSLQPYSLVGMNTGSYSENFSFIENGDEFVEDSARNYNFLGMEQKIYAPEEGDDKEKKDKSSVLESYMAERDTDIRKIFGNGNSGFNRML